MTETPPKGLAWTIAPAGRVVALALAAISLAVSMYVGYRYIGLIECLAAQGSADAWRTGLLADATDVERAADLDLITGASGLSDAERREVSAAARRNTDMVRKANPAPRAHPCS